MSSGLEIELMRAIYGFVCGEAERLEHELNVKLAEKKLDRQTYDSLFDAVEALRRRPDLLVLAGVPARMSANRIPKQTNTEEAVGP